MLIEEMEVKRFATKLIRWKTGMNRSIILLLMAPSSFLIILFLYIGRDIIRQLLNYGRTVFPISYIITFNFRHLDTIEIIYSVIFFLGAFSVLFGMIWLIISMASYAYYKLGALKSIERMDLVADNLIGRIRDRNYCRFKTSLIVLGDIRNKRAVSALVPVLKDKDAQYRQEAAKALGKIRDENAIEPLKMLSDDPDENVRRAAQLALSEIRMRRVFIELEVLAAEARKRPFVKRFVEGTIWTIISSSFGLFLGLLGALSGFVLMILFGGSTRAPAGYVYRSTGSEISILALPLFLGGLLLGPVICLGIYIFFSALIEETITRRLGTTVPAGIGLFVTILGFLAAAVLLIVFSTEILAKLDEWMPV
ncbi:MAG: HEAT repeat domain-containing protein [Firmicutes bacterium]|nr:HEAT repeat domain-containing protein [Bacillota bacterium]